MSYYDDEDDAEPRLTLADMVRALSGEDRDAFSSLMQKALDSINTETGGIVTQLRSENATLKHSVRSLTGDLQHVREKWRECRLRLEQTETHLAERQRVLGLTDHERASELAAENGRLKETVSIQRRLLCEHDLAKRQGRADASPWLIFKAGLSSAFVNPLTAIAGLKG